MIDHVRASIIEYLAGRFDADSLATRLPDGWELDEAGTPEARTLTLKAIGCLAEYQRGDKADDELRVALSNLVRDPKPATLGSKTPIVLHTVGFTKPLPAANKSPQVALA